jgi:osmotically-inducible protein OsmY
MSRLVVTVLFVALLAGCTASQQQRAKADMNDAFIGAQVKAKIAAVDAATVSLVIVDVNHSAVTLTGQVHSQSERSKVDAAARSVSGITKLDDRLTINPKAPTAQEIADDLGLQAKVRGALAAQTGVNALKVQVTVHGSVVVLEGTVSTKAMHEVILETVRGVPGVRRVIDHLHLEPH